MIRLKDLKYLGGFLLIAAACGALSDLADRHTIDYGNLGWIAVAALGMVGFGLGVEKFFKR